jgi:hypothetical protein
MCFNVLEDPTVGPAAEEDARFIDLEVDIRLDPLVFSMQRLSSFLRIPQSARGQICDSLEAPVVQNC